VPGQRESDTGAGMEPVTMGLHMGMPLYAIEKTRSNQELYVGSDGTFHLFGDWK